MSVDNRRLPVTPGGAQGQVQEGGDLAAVALGLMRAAD